LCIKAVQTTWGGVQGLAIQVNLIAKLGR
jgi:hypothetical protein